MSHQVAMHLPSSLRASEDSASLVGAAQSSDSDYACSTRVSTSAYNDLPCLHHAFRRVTAALNKPLKHQTGRT